MAKILLMEDDLAISRMYEAAFRLEKHDLTLVADGKAGLEKLAAEKFDIILLDVMMPLMNGFDVLKTLKGDEATKMIPVIMLTNLIGENEEVALREGAVKYIVKSEHDPSDVVEMVGKVLAANKDSKTDTRG